jgi:cobalt-zinc-cadmium efflux system outer membrane protein
MRRVEVGSKHDKLMRCFGAALAMVSLPLAGSARAAPASPLELPTDPVLATLIEQSLAERPELAQARAEAAAATERISQAGALPDPVLQLGVQNDGFTNWEVGKMESSFYSIMASQTFPWPGKLRLQSEVAGYGAEQAKQSIARSRLSTEAEVRRAYLNLILVRDRLALLDRLEAIWQKSAAIARVRYETGQGAQSDVLRAQLELNRIRQRRSVMQAELTAEVQALNRLRGHPLDEPIETAVHLADLPMPALRDSAALAQDAIDRSPELAAAHIEITQLERSVSLARKSTFPDITASVGVMPRGGDFPPMWLATISFPLPVFAGFKQSRAVAENEARLLASQKQAEGLEQVLRLRAEQRRTTLAAVLESVRLYQGGLLVQSAATADSTLAQYEVGKVTFASVLEVNAGFIADQDSYLQALAQAHRLEIERVEVGLGPVAAASASMGGGSAGVPGAGPQMSITQSSIPDSTSPVGSSGSSSSMSSM